jgi:hypothetical protein
VENHINKKKFFAERSYRERNERERKRERDGEEGMKTKNKGEDFI